MNSQFFPYQLDSFFCFRTPLLPWEEFLQWSEGLTAVEGSADAVSLKPVLAQDLALLRARLKILIARPETLEALRVASPDLVDSLARWEDKPESEKGQRTELALVRYFARMCHRSTPFGLFAGHSTGQMGASTALLLGPPCSYQRRTRLDMGLICSLVDQLQTAPDLRLQLTYRANNSLYRCGGRLRYAKASNREGERSYRLAAILEEETLTTTLQRALLEGTPDLPRSWVIGRQAIQHRTVQITPILTRMKALAVEGDLMMDGVLASLVHMGLNLLLRSTQLQEEMVIHAFLGQLYASRIARTALV
jgi:hypothetical protein